MPAGHHGVAPGDLSSGKPVREWHTDGLYEQDTPSVATSMSFSGVISSFPRPYREVKDLCRPDRYSVSVKESGGDTLFMDAREIYDALDADERALFDCATATYSRAPLSMHASGYRARVAADGDVLANNTGALYAASVARRGAAAPGDESTAHPAVWQLPDGDRRRALVVAPMWVSRLVGADGAPLLGHDALHRTLGAALAKGGPSEVAHAWAVGDFFVWDNRALLHSATPNDGFGAGLRLLHRIRLCGDRAPAGPATCP